MGGALPISRAKSVRKVVTNGRVFDVQDLIAGK
jgi:hypothetical protein